MIKLSNDFHRLFFKAFSNQTRYGILHVLQKGSLSVGEIAKRLDFEQSRVSHNLRCLEQCGFVHVEQNGKSRVYSLDEKTIIPMLELVNNHVKRYKKRLGACGVLQK